MLAPATREEVDGYWAAFLVVPRGWAPSSARRRSYADAGTVRDPSAGEGVRPLAEAEWAHGGGLGAAVFAFATRAAQDAGLVPQRRVLAFNTHSLQIARRLGRVPCATSLAVRLRNE